MSNVLFFVVGVHDELQSIFAYAFVPLLTSLVWLPDKDLLVFQYIVNLRSLRGHLPLPIPCAAILFIFLEFRA